MYGEQADQAPRKKKEAYCSWCYEFSIHYFIKETSTWLCDACKGRTAESPRCQDSMARLEGKGKSGAVCAKSMPDWEEVCDKKKKILSKARSLTKIRYEMTRESTARHLADKEGVLPPTPWQLRADAGCTVPALELERAAEIARTQLDSDASKTG
jgi:hypothetical protein